jgi:carbamoyltransferase
MPVRIVGLNLSHDSSAALVEDGQLRAGLALERTSRVKRGTVPVHAYPAAMASLVGDLLGGMDLQPQDVDYWVVTSTESRDEADEAHLADTLGLLVPQERRLALPHPGHHLAHASAAFYTSGFEQAAALVVDAYGSLIDGGRERESGFVFRTGHAPRQVLRTVRESARIAGRVRGGVLRIPRELSGIGEVYRVVSLALGFSEHGTTYDDAGKTMGLAAYGTPLSREEMFIRVDGDTLSFDRAAASLVELGFAVPDGDELRLVPRPAAAPLNQAHRDLAAQVQTEFEAACLHLAQQLLQRADTRSLVLSGGCALNSVLNTRIARECGLERLFVFPAATDDGNAAGAALYAHHVMLGHGIGPHAEPAPRLTHVLLGPPRLARADVQALARSFDHPVRRHATSEHAAAAAAAAIGEGQIVGWFQDRAEFGPRALGARSILCHPGIAGMKDRLNARVKFRESFRPFAASVLAEHADKWFEMPCPDSPFMLLVCPVHAGRREAISEVVHADGTCRIQTIEADYPGAIRTVVERFEQATGLPMVLNTSFNLRGAPIVESPQEALDCLYGSRLDRLFIGEWEFEAPDFTRLRPKRIGQNLADATAEAIWALADGSRTLGQIAAQCGLQDQTAVDLALELRRRGAVAWAGLPATPRPRFPLPQYDPDSALV